MDTVYFRVFVSEMCFSKFKEDYVQFPSQKSQIPRFRPDSLVMRPDAHQCLLFKLASVRTSQQHVRTLFRVREESCFLSASVRTTWQYFSDASQCSTSKRIFFADIDMGRQLQPSGRQVYIVRTLSLIRQDVEKNCNCPDVRVTPSGRQSVLWKLRAAEVQPFES
jgi:hypothetical protein